MKRFMKYLIQLMLLMPLLLPLSAFALSGDVTEGKVLEEGTNKPIPEAIVIARWSGHLATFAHGKTVCYHVLSTTTNENGAYRFPAWKKKITEDWQKNVRPETVIITVHKPGYAEYRPPGYVRTEAFKQNIRYLKPFTGTREERFKYLTRIFGSSGCGTNDGSDRNSIPFMKALYDEATSIAQTQEEKRMLEFFLYAIEKLEIGFEQAEKRHLERVGK